MSHYVCNICAEEIAVAEITAGMTIDGHEGRLRIADLCSDCWDLFDRCIEHIKNGRYEITNKQIILGQRQNPMKEADPA